VGALHGAFALIYEPVHDMWKFQTEAQNLCSKLDDTVNFKCTWIQEPMETEVNL